MDENFVGINSIVLRYSVEHFTPLVVDDDSPATTFKGKVDDATGKGLSIIIKKRPKKY